MDQLQRHALEIQKRLNKKEKVAYKKILKEYELMTKEILAELAALYEKTEKDGVLTYAEVNRFSQLQQFERRIVAQVSLLGSNNLNHIMNLLEESYDLSYSHMSYAIEKEAQVLLQGATPYMASLVTISTANPIYGIRLNAAQQRDRQLTVNGINDAINAGIKAGDTYGGIAKRIRAVFDSSIRRSMTIARTETHRVRNRAEQDSSMNAHNQGVKMSKTWRNMDDERVRDTKSANHVDMEGVKVMVDELYIMVDHPEHMGLGPGLIEGPKSGSQNIQCRCFSQRKIVRIEPQVPKNAVKGTYEDWLASKKMV